MCSNLSDACDPSWRSTRDGLIGSAFVVSIVAFIFGAAMVWTHIYYHKSKEILFLITTLCLALFPGMEEGRRKSAWYTLFAHALNGHRIPSQLCL